MVDVIVAALNCTFYQEEKCVTSLNITYLQNIYILFYMIAYSVQR